MKTGIFISIITLITLISSCDKNNFVLDQSPPKKKLEVTDTTFENYDFYTFYGKKVSEFLDLIVLDTLWTSGKNYVYYEENCQIMFNHGIMVSIYVHSDSICQYLDSAKRDAQRDFNFDEFKNKRIYEIYIINKYQQRIFPSYLHLNPREIVFLIKILDKIITFVFGQNCSIWNNYLDDYYIKICRDFRVFNWIFLKSNFMINILSMF